MNTLQPSKALTPCGLACGSPPCGPGSGQARAPPGIGYLLSPVNSAVLVLRRADRRQVEGKLTLSVVRGQVLPRLPVSVQPHPCCSL